MNYLAVQPPWPRPNRVSDVDKYLPLPLLKLCSYYRSKGHRAELISDEGTTKRGTDCDNLFLAADVPFMPDVILFSSSFSFWVARYLKPCVERYHIAFPNAEIRIGGPHPSAFPEIYRELFPYANIHIGSFPEADRIPIDFSLLKSRPKTQIISFSDGCRRRCPQCVASKLPYVEYSWEDISPRIKMTRIILDDMSLVAHSQCEKIIHNLGKHRVDGKPITSIELQGGYDVRLLVNSLHLVPMLKSARFQQIRMAWDGGMDVQPAVEKCVEAFRKAGYAEKTLRCYVLSNYAVPFDVVMKKLDVLAKLRVGPIISRFRPLTLLEDNYISQKKSQAPGEYFVHPSWKDAQVRVCGSIGSDIAKMVRASVATLNEVRAYYGKPSYEESLRIAA